MNLQALALFVSCGLLAFVAAEMEMKANMCTDGFCTNSNNCENKGESCGEGMVCCKDGIERQEGAIRFKEGNVTLMLREDSCNQGTTAECKTAFGMCQASCNSKKQEKLAESCGSGSCVCCGCKERRKCTNKNRICVYDKSLCVANTIVNKGCKDRKNCVCCTPVDPVSTTTPSPTDDYLFCSANNCGQSPVSRITGGTEAGVNEFPWLVAVGIYYEGSNTSLFPAANCGGSIIKPSYVLTAAHCLERVKTLLIRAGMHNYTDVYQELMRWVTKEEHIVRHPSYDAVTLKDDLALIFLDRPFTFVNPWVWPICLGLPKDHGKGSKVVAAGWGAESFGGDINDVLEKVELDLISFKSCNETYSGIPEASLCTFTPGKDACQGDSGGPLMVKIDDSTYTIIGLVSFGEGCGGDVYPGVYVNVTTYSDWITSNTGGTSC